jgi:formylglycine-generating enzyme required for sulfatase activity
MKTLKFLSWLGAVALFTAPLPASTLTPARLSLHLSSGLEVSGAVGGLYAIDYTTNYAQTNAWRSLTNLTLPASPYLVPDTAPSATGCRFYRAVALTSPTNLPNMVFIPPGVFSFGSPSNEVDRYDDEGPQTTVTISQSFWIGTYPVTQQEYLSVMTNNPSYFTGDLSRPVEQVSWLDASNYCRLLTQRDRASGQIPARYQYRLPTEAEWEYACRAGTTTRFYYGEDLGYAALTANAWYRSNSGYQTHPVGQKPPNPWGLFDMSGNVWEWCQDWYAPSHPGGSVSDPQGPVAGTIRVLRGGSWYDQGWLCRSACRIGDDPIANYYDNYGFRVVLAPSGP